MAADVTFRRLLTDEVVVLTPTRSPDAYGDEALGYPDADSSQAVPALLQQTAAQEVTTGRDTQVSDWLLFLLPEVSITGDSRVFRISDGVTFEVLGPPNVLTHPRKGPHHIEARLRTFQGTA